jgi:transcriptional regulator with XRE-family HTH domain
MPEAAQMADITLKRLLSRLKQLRDVHGLTQEQFAELSGISYKYYQAVEAGRKPDLRLSTLQRLASAYGIEVWELLSPALPKSKTPRKRPPRPRQSGR